MFRCPNQWLSEAVDFGQSQDEELGPNGGWVIHYESGAEDLTSQPVSLISQRHAGIVSLSVNLVLENAK